MRLDALRCNQPVHPPEAPSASALSRHPLRSARGLLSGTRITRMPVRASSPSGSALKPPGAEQWHRPEAVPPRAWLRDAGAACARCSMLRW